MTLLRPAVLTTAGLAVVAAAIAWAVGVSVVQSAFVAALVVTFAGALSMRSFGRTIRWPDHRPPPRRGTRPEVSGLSWSLQNRNDAMSRATADRLWVLAQRRLARVGVDLSNPEHAAAADRALGHAAYSVLIADPTQPVRYSALVRCVDALERMDGRR